MTAEPGRHDTMENHFAQFHDTTCPTPANIFPFSVANDPLSRYATAGPCRHRVWVEPDCTGCNSRARTTTGPHGRRRTLSAANRPRQSDLYPNVVNHRLLISASGEWEPSHVSVHHASRIALSIVEPGHVGRPESARGNHAQNRNLGGSPAPPAQEPSFPPAKQASTPGRL